MLENWCWQEESLGLMSGRLCRGAQPDVGELVLSEESLGLMSGRLCCYTQPDAGELVLAGGIIGTHVR